MQADAYPGYGKLFADRKIIEVACFAHARHKFADIIKTVKEPSLANQAIEFIGLLYDIERRSKIMTLIERYHYRRRFSKPILKDFRRWLCLQNKTAPPKTPLGQAVQYCLNHWQKKLPFCRLSFWCRTSGGYLFTDRIPQNDEYQYL